MNDLQTTWAAFKDQPNTDTLQAWLRAATAVLNAGVGLPDEMLSTYRLATAPQQLPPVTVTAAPSWFTLLAIIGFALVARKALTSGGRRR